MTTVLARNWWALAVRGVLAIVFGLIAFASPATAVAAFVLLFGVYAIVEGILSIVAGVRAAEHHERWWALLLKGIVDILAGLIALVIPAAAAFAFVLVVAVWAIVTGVLELVAAIRLRREVRGEWLLILNAIVSLALGAVLLLRPAAGLLVLVWWIGAYAIVFGIVLLALAFRLRARLHRTAVAASPPA
jgi:uncharacterized membrane protein HdeD (DUF308 family)